METTLSHWTYDPLRYRRRPTREVAIGDVVVGGGHPIRIQSMTTTSTWDVDATVRQTVALAEAGCEIVRVTVPTRRDADALPAIRAELRRCAVRVPLVADIHFTPAVAMKAVEHVEKIRINPGNFADKKRFAVREYTDAEYGAELERIEAVFAPLVRRCRELGASMRIGTNHGSLSDRIMNRYGDSPEGMVESALEFVRICEAHDFRDLILSMKASNPVVVLQVYRLLAHRMTLEGMDYPFHLGVTEAGDGEDGRIKSAVGIGTLLAEGIGDTVRVSLTEDPVREIPVARALVAPYNRPRDRADAAPSGVAPAEAAERWPRDPFRYEPRASREVALGPRAIGGGRPPLVEVALDAPLDDETRIRREIDAQAGARAPEETRAEVVSVTLTGPEQIAALERLRSSVELVAPAVAVSARVDPSWLAEAGPDERRRWCAAAHRLHLRVDACQDDSWGRLVREIADACRARGTGLLVEIESDAASLDDALDRVVALGRDAGDACGSVLQLAVGTVPGISPLHATRRLVAALDAAGLETPVVLVDRPGEREADPLLDGSAMVGGLLCDGIGDAVQIHAGSPARSRRLAFGVLQAARVRITRTEFISCPSCGRTLFDLEQTTARIKRRTAHLKGVKIAVMGCVVNGPGEMADADFGYVGWGEDRIALFVGKDMVEKDVPTDQADERLVALIRRHGRWTDPPE